VKSLAGNEVKRAMLAALSSLSVEAKDSIKKKLRSNGAALLGGAAATMSFGPIAGLLAAGAAKAGLLDNVVDTIVDDFTKGLASSKGLDDTAEKLVASLPDAATGLLNDRQVAERLEHFVGEAAEELLRKIDVKRIVEAELLAHDDAELEALIDRVASNELVFIQVFGGLLGGVAGLALVWPWMLLPLGGVFLAGWQVGRIADARAAREDEARARAEQDARAASAQEQAGPVDAEFTARPALTQLPPDPVLEAALRETARVG
jgi:hypothetical protein